jgi:hypothetical protein
MVEKRHIFSDLILRVKVIITSWEIAIFMESWRVKQWRGAI